MVEPIHILEAVMVDLKLIEERLECQMKVLLALNESAIQTQKIIEKQPKIIDLLIKRIKVAESPT